MQTYISNLRGELGDVITATGSGYTLGAERDDVDALRFEDMVGRTTQSSDPETIASDLRAALALWRGHPFADVDGILIEPQWPILLTELFCGRGAPANASQPVSALSRVHMDALEGGVAHGRVHSIDLDEEAGLVSLAGSAALFR